MPGGGVFAGLPNPMLGCRYHSLVVERRTLPDEFEVTAWTDDGTIMAIEHRQEAAGGDPVSSRIDFDRLRLSTAGRFFARAGIDAAGRAADDRERTQRPAAADIDFLPPGAAGYVLMTATF